MDRTTRALCLGFSIGAVALGGYAAFAWIQGHETEDELVRAAVPAILGGLLALFALAMGIAIWLEGRQRAALREQASRMGFAFAADGSNLAGAGFLQLPWFRNLRPGASGHLNALTGSVEGFDEVAVFTFARTRSAGSSNVSYRCAAVAFRLPSPLPVTFRLQPAGLGDRALAQLEGGAPATLPGDERFSGRYLIECDDPAGLAAALPEALRRELTLDGEWHVDGGGEWVVLWKLNHVPEVDAYPGHVEQARRIAARLRA